MITMPETQTLLQDPQPDHHNVLLLDRLRHQVEYYFSYANLCRDTFLQSLLASTDHIGAVPTDVIASFSKIRFLCQTNHHPVDPHLIAQCLKHSQVVTISEDGKYITPNQLPDFQSISIQSVMNQQQQQQQHQQNRFLHTHSSPPSSPSSNSTSASSSLGSVPGLPLVPQLLTTTKTRTTTKERTTVIVRDLPMDCSEEELIEVFTTHQNGPPNSLQRLGIGSTWYVTFATEAYAVHAVATSWGKTLRGYPIQARMKSEVPLQVMRQSEQASTPILRPTTHPHQMMWRSVNPHELHFDYSTTQSHTYSFGPIQNPFFYTVDHTLKGGSSDGSFHSHHSPTSLPIPGEIPLYSTLMGRKKRHRTRRSRRRRPSSASLDGSDAPSLTKADSNPASNDYSAAPNYNKNKSMPRNTVGNSKPQQNVPLLLKGQCNKFNNGDCHMDGIGSGPAYIPGSSPVKTCHDSSEKVPSSFHDGKMRTEYN